MEAMPNTKITVTPTFYQLGIFVLDGSGSMADPTNGGTRKADEVDKAMKDLLTRFKKSRRSSCFSFAVVTFDTKASLRVSPTPAENINEMDDYDPMHGHGGGTLISEGLNIAEQLANDYLQQQTPDGLPYSVIILIMTDGECHNSKETQRIAQQIKNGSNGRKITICTTFFSTLGKAIDQNAKNLLIDIATNGSSGFTEVSDAESLRDFFKKSISDSLGGINIISTSATNLEDV